jgi:membrane protease YdiL (CAAX protease family)
MSKIRGFLAVLWPAVVALLIPFYIGIVSVFIYFQSVYGAYFIITPSRDRTVLEMLSLLEYSGYKIIDYIQPLTDVFTALIPIIWIFLFFFWYRSMLQKENMFGEGGNPFEKVEIRLFTFKNIFFLALVALGCQIVIGSCMELILPHFEKIMEDYNELMEEFMYGNVIIIFVTTVILAPFSEELMFRGVIMKKAQKIAPAGAAILIQAILFAIFHMNIVQSVYTFPAGLILGYVAYKFKSIKASIVLHMMFNALSYVMIMPENMILFIGYMVLGGMILALGLWWVSKVGLTGQRNKNIVSEG